MPRTVDGAEKHIPKRRILALGLFAPKLNASAKPRGMAGVAASARASFPNEGDEIVTIRSLSRFERDFRSLTEELTEEQKAGRFRGIASGYFVQEALEGGHGITDIHFDLTGVESAREPSHAGSELRSLIAHIRSFHPRKVTIHFKTSAGLTTIARQATRFGGAPLPGWLADHFPGSMQKHPTRTG